MEHKRWNVHVCERYSNPVGVLNYLGRYLNGGPISEKRLLSLDAMWLASSTRTTETRTAVGSPR